MPEQPGALQAFPAVLLLPGDAFDTQGHQVMGRRVAGREFARAMAGSLRSGEQLLVAGLAGEEARRLGLLLQPRLGSGGQLAISPHLPMAQISASGSLHVPDPNLGRWTWLRVAQGHQAFSLTGVIHTLCSETVVSCLHNLLHAPLQPWDALVCTSAAGRSVVKAALEARLEQLRQRLQLSEPLRVPDGPQLPVIPLAIDPEPLQAPLDRQQRRLRARQALGLDPDAFVVCFVGRLSFHSKAHPLPLYRALDQLARDCPGVVLLECGHLFNAPIGQAFDELASCFPALSVKRLGGLEPATEAEKLLALEAADAFTSPADNLQETFGLSLLEAMAVELPLVVSDWDGYRDLVVHEDTGFLIPTADALSGQAQPDEVELAYRLGFLDYDTMIGCRSSAVVVDHAALLQAFRTLREQPQLARSMGRRAAQRLESFFSWRVVAEQYRELWHDLTARRLAALPTAATATAEASYGELFAAYPTQPFRSRQGRRAAHSLDPALLQSPMNQSLLGVISGQRLVAVQHLLEHQAQLSLEDLTGLGLSPIQAMQMLAACFKLGLLEEVTTHE